MCIFPGKVEKVSKTNIFAGKKDDSQVLLYQMELHSKNDTAMILPIPVSHQYRENAVNFYDLSNYESLFKDLRELFPPDPAAARGGDLNLSFSSRSTTIAIQTVGSYEASYVPTPDDFSRLDPRFSLSKSILSKLPQYTDFAFVVFKLKAGNIKVHPMAFTFKTRCTDMLYFPTVHVHEGKVKSKDRFNHNLYAQGPVDKKYNMKKSYKESITTTHKILHSRSEGLIKDNTYFFRKRMNGIFLNTDQWVPLALKNST